MHASSVDLSETLVALGKAPGPPTAPVFISTSKSRCGPQPRQHASDLVGSTAVYAVDQHPPPLYRNGCCRVVDLL
jgi:hypothetical protein